MLPSLYQAVFLDSGPAGLITNPKVSPENDACKRWVKRLIDAGVPVILPEIIDYELRRELLRLRKTNGLVRLDVLKSATLHQPISTESMLRAAELWAQVRQEGKPTADDKALDGDVILAAQMLTSPYAANAVIAPSNLNHLSRFGHASLWQIISEQTIQIS